MDFFIFIFFANGDGDRVTLRELSEIEIQKSTEQLQGQSHRGNHQTQEEVTSISLLVLRHMKRLRPAMTNAIVVSRYNYT